MLLKKVHHGPNKPKRNWSTIDSKASPSLHLASSFYKPLNTASNNNKLQPLNNSATCRNCAEIHGCLIPQFRSLRSLSQNWIHLQFAQVNSISPHKLLNRVLSAIGHTQQDLGHTRSSGHPIHSDHPFIRSE
jgi:hypothetical protein